MSHQSVKLSDSVINSLEGGGLHVPGGPDVQEVLPMDDAALQATSCVDRTKRILVGVIFTLLIALSWVGTLHLLKMTFILGRDGSVVQFLAAKQAAAERQQARLLASQSRDTMLMGTQYDHHTPASFPFPANPHNQATFRPYLSSNNDTYLMMSSPGHGPATGTISSNSFRPVAQASRLVQSQHQHVATTSNPTLVTTQQNLQQPPKSRSSSTPSRKSVPRKSSSSANTSSLTTTPMAPSSENLVALQESSSSYFNQTGFSRNNRSRSMWHQYKTASVMRGPGGGQYPAPYGSSKDPEVPEAKPTQFDAPFFVTWYISVFNVLFLPIFTLLNLITNKFEINSSNSGTSQEESNGGFKEISLCKIYTESINQFMDRGYSWAEFTMRIGFFCVLLVLTNYSIVYTLSKSFIDISILMSLFSCTITMMYLLSWVVLHQKFVGVRIVAAIICDTGIALLAYSDGVHQTSTLAGVMLSTGAALGAAVYKILYQRMVVISSFAQMSLFFSLVGLFNLLFMWPLVLVLYLAKVEVIEGWTSIPWIPMTGAAILLLVANVLGNFGILWTFDIFLTLGLLIAIPISSAIDTSVYFVEFKGMKLCGVLLIMFGFCVVLLPDNWNEYLSEVLREKLAKWKRREQFRKSGRIQADDTSTAHLSRLRTPSGRVK